MSGYIDSLTNGETMRSRNKFEQLLEDGGTEVENVWQPNLICVITNPTFDVAVYCYTEEVYNAIKKDRDDMLMRWLIHPKARELGNM